MGRIRKKNRTHLKGPQKGEAEENVPKSFVIKSGHVTKAISQLVRDTRKIFEPNTASRLRERPNARLRDYLTIAPSLKVTHLLAFTLTDAANVHLRVARFPQGPTLTFRVQRYSLTKDLVGAGMRGIGKAPGGEYRNPPLLVLNGFQQPQNGAALPQLRLMSTMFQGLFPPIQVEKSALPTFRRVLLISYSHVTGLISFRHFTITVRPHGVSRRVRKLLTTAGAPSQSASSSARSRKGVDLSNTDDIADYLLRRVGSEGGGTPGYDSASETEASEGESDTNAVELPEDYVGRGNKKGERKAVRLVETGPRQEWKLIKVVEGLVGSKRGEGETVFHEFVHKSSQEAEAMQRQHEERRDLKDERRRQQAENVARKKKEKDRKKGKNVEESEEEGDSSDDDLDVEGLSDVDPEEELEKLRQRKVGFQGDDDDEDFEYEDRGAAADVEDLGEDDGDDWGSDAGAGEGELTSDEESSESEEEEVKPAKKKKVAGKRK
ncbi:ribosome biogenesis protein SSF1/2 [Cryptococcus wingfieldii CBS 7118]|uniref:Ribosome biogenesis protein SSF1/2 n=1 Tax=Cryptococcus wingfieldii CBS 7118 TaxID=1295528 RepID=A0A1E3JBA9_9TREE|nr:ribosome biogenesis protein SSF1/2 [Cryptococcus wingfieldii CBS 7118]ODN97396.1 ribosome biogenesis protein SSF1/2 [Cryptococcus wingfieldii CBS 7118]